MKTYEDLTVEQQVEYNLLKSEEEKAGFLEKIVDEIPVSTITESQTPAKVETIEQIIEQDPAKVAEVEEIKTNSANNQKRVNKKVTKKTEEKEQKSKVLPLIGIGLLAFGLYKLATRKPVDTKEKPTEATPTENITENKNSYVEQKTEATTAEETSSGLGQF